MTDGDAGTEGRGDAADGDRGETGTDDVDRESTRRGTDAPPIAESYADEWSIRGIVSTIVPLLMLTSVLQMGSGTVLETFQAQLLEHPSLLVLVPVVIGTAGNLASIVASRLTTQLHLGTLEFAPTNPNVRANVGAVFALAATVFVLLGIAAWAIGRSLGGDLALGTLLVVTLVSGMILAAWVVVVTAVTVTVSYRLGYDPDDTTIPIVTNVCDVTGVLVLFAVIWAVV